jgi:hypothetical protein
LRVLTVLRSGGEYNVSHVERLAAQVEEHNPGLPFACLSDVAAPGWIKAQHDWPGWWCKMEAFRIPGPVLYMDLDMSIIGDLSPILAAPGPFTVLRDFNYPQREVCSALMAWRGDQSGLYSHFKEDPVGHMAANNTPRWWGDQGFVERHTESRDYWQDVAPGAVVSWKKHCGGGVPPGARVIAFHGKPRPWEV